MNLFTDSIVRAAVFAQAATPTPPAPADPGIVPQAPAMAGLPAGAVGSSITVGILFLFLVIAFIGVKSYGMKANSILLGTCIGVLGATGIVGSLAWAIIAVIVRIVAALAGSFG